MFNMENIGRKISSARKAQNMTQMDLADRLNISFQAISNWERGISMPDISKLPEISEILHISIDDLLGKSSSLVNGLLSEDGDAYLQNAEIPSEELIEAAPILKPSQFNEAFQKSDLSLDLSELNALFPYLDDETLDLMAQKAYTEQGIPGLRHLAAFLPDSTIDSLAQDAVSQNGPGAVAPIAPFLSSKLLHQIMEQYLFDQQPPYQLSHLTSLFPFFEEKDIDALAQKIYAAGETASLASIAPFMSQAAIDRIVKDWASSQGLNAVTSLLPFASNDIMKQMLYGKYL